MNLAKAKRRWKAWDRYCAHMCKITDGRVRTSPGLFQAWKEQFAWRESGVHGPRRARRLNRRVSRGPRR